MKLTKIARVVSVLALMLISASISGCSNYTGKYTESDKVGAKTIEVDSDSIHLSEYIDGGFTDNYGKIKNIAKSSDGNTVTLTGELDYSGGSGTAFGVTVAPGNERHWLKPFTATINMAEKTLTYNGVIIVDSLTMPSWNVTLKKMP